MSSSSSPLRSPGYAWADHGSDDEDLDAYQLPGAFREAGCIVAGRVLFVDGAGAYVEIGDVTTALLPASSPGVDQLRAGDEVEDMRVAGRDKASSRLLLELLLDDASEDFEGEACQIKLEDGARELRLRPLPGPKVANSARQSAEESEAAAAEAKLWRRPLPRAQSSSSSLLDRAKNSRNAECRDFRRAVQGLFSRLRPVTLEPIADQLSQIPLTSAAELATAAAALLRWALAAEGSADQSETCADLACRLQKAWPKLPLTAAAGGGERATTSFMELLAEACRHELWQPARVPEAAAKQVGADAVVQRQRQRIDHARFLACLILYGELPTAVAGAVASELLLLKTASARPGEEDVLYACEILSLVGGALAAASSASAELLDQLCNRLAELQKSKRSNGSVLNPLVLAYSEEAILAMQQVLDMDRDGWPVEQEVCKLNGETYAPQTETSPAPVAAELLKVSGAARSKKTKHCLLDFTAPTELMKDASLPEPDAASAAAPEAKDELSLSAAWAKFRPSAPKPKKSSRKLETAGSSMIEEAPVVADVALSLLEKMHNEIQNRAEAKKQMLLQAQAETEAASRVNEGIPAETYAEEELGREADEDQILLKAVRRRWGRSQSHDRKREAAGEATPTGARWRTSSRDKPQRATAAPGTSWAAGAAATARNCSEDACESGSDSDALALELCVEAEEEMAREEKEDQEGFW